MPIRYLLGLVDEVARELRLRKSPMAVFTEFDESPFVCGLLRPMLVLPRGLTTALRSDQWRDVVLHELAHLQAARPMVGAGSPKSPASSTSIIRWRIGICFNVRLERECWLATNGPLSCERRAGRGRLCTGFSSSGLPCVDAVGA